MANISFKKFGGSRPRLDDHLLGETQAAYALNARFEHGSLDAWREPRPIHAGTAGHQTAFQHGCCWFTYPTCVDYALGSVSCADQFFLAGRVGYPERAVVNQETCEVTYHRLGLPCPTQVLEVNTALLTYDKDSTGYSYAYQYVNRFHEVSALSPATEAVLMKDGSTAVLSGWAVPDASWDVSSIRFYRTVSSVGASMTAPDANNTPDTTWMLVGETDINAVAFTADGWAEEMETALQEEIVMPPPENLRGITWVGSQNTLAGFVGNRVYFTENNQYHNWRHFLELDDNICAIAEVNNHLYVMTDGRPYVIAATANCKQAHLREAMRLPVALPMVACGNKHVGILPQGVVYPSHDGLVMLAGQSLPSLITNSFYAPENWHQLKPHTVVPETHSGKLFVFGQGGSFVLGFSDGIEPGWDLDTHSELSDTDVVDTFKSRHGDLFFLKQDGTVYQWNRGDTLRPYEWHSPVSRHGMPMAYASLQMMIRNGFVDSQVFFDDELAFDETLYSSDVSPLPMWSIGYDWQIRLRGTANVSLVSLASSMRDF